MKIINTQQELEALIDGNNNIIIDDDLKINCNIKIKANIKVRNIIEARDLEVDNLEAWNIKARDLKAENIEASNIKARDLKANDISYYAVCFAYKSIICRSIKGRRGISKHFVLDGTITETNNNDNK